MALPPSIRRPLAAAIALAALLVPATAQAEEDQPYTNPTIARYMQIAERHWAIPAPSCTDEHGATVGPNTVLYDEPEPGVVAAAEQPGCRIWLDRDYWPAAPSEEDCVTIVHEWGHLLGYGHSRNPNSIMYSYPTGGAPECAFFGDRAKARRARLARKRAGARRKAARGARHGALRGFHNRTWPHDSWSSEAR